MRDFGQEAPERTDSFFDVLLLVLIVILVQVLSQLMLLSVALREAPDVADSIRFLAI